MGSAAAASSQARSAAQDDVSRAAQPASALGRGSVPSLPFPSLAFPSHPTSPSPPSLLSLLLPSLPSHPTQHVAAGAAKATDRRVALAGFSPGRRARPRVDGGGGGGTGPELAGDPRRAGLQAAIGRLGVRWSYGGCGLFIVMWAIYSVCGLFIGSLS